MNTPLGLLLTTGLVLFLLIPASAWLVSWNRTDPAARIWYAATVFGALSASVFVLRSEIPSWVSVTLTSLCVNCMVLLMGESLRREFQGGSPPLGGMAAVLGAQLGLMVTLVLTRQEGCLAPLSLACISVLDVWLLARLLKVIRLRSSSSLWIVVMAVLAILGTNLVRFAEYAQSGIWPSLLSFTPASNAAFIANFIAVVFYTFGYWGFLIEKTQSAYRQSLEETRDARQAEEIAQARNRIYVQLIKERDELIRKLAQTQKIAQAGALSASIAHELNQPLTVIQLDTQEALLSNENPANRERTADLLHRILRHNEQAARIIRTVRGIFSQEAPEPESRPLDDIIRAVLGVIEGQSRQLGITVRMELNCPLQVRLGAGEMEHVILNLCVNAAEAMRQQVRKELTIRSWTTHEVAQLSVEDTGPGIDEIRQQEIFDLLKGAKQDGLGLGLWLSRFILERHGGRISLDTRVAEGARFLIEIPLGQIAPQAAAPQKL